VSAPSADFDHEATVAACAGGERGALHALYEQEGPRLPGVVLVAPPAVLDQGRRLERAGRGDFSRPSPRRSPTCPWSKPAGDW